MYCNAFKIAVMLPKICNYLIDFVPYINLRSNENHTIVHPRWLTFGCPTQISPIVNYQTRTRGRQAGL